MVTTKNRRIDHSDLKDIHEDKPVLTPNPRLDLAKPELPDDDLLKYVSDEIFEEIREVTKEFRNDLYVRLLSTEVLDNNNAADDLSNTYLTDFVMNGSGEELPGRFVGLSSKTKRIAQGIQRATLLAAKAMGRKMDTSKQIDMDTREEDTDETPVTCNADCPCRNVKKRIEEEGYLFPCLFECEDVCEFMDKLSKDLEDKTPYGDKIPENVQLVFTNSIPENLRSHVRTPFETNRIVRACAQLMREGGHIFLRTTACKFDEYKAAFTAHEDASGRATFKVDPSAYILTAKPEDQATQTDDSGPTHIDITIQMMHAVKIGKLEPEQVLKKVDLKSKGFVAGRFAACTNVMDGAVARTTQGYAISLNGAKEIVSRYSKSGDIVLDFWADRSWTAEACISLPEARMCIGGVENTAGKEKLTTKLTDRIIYQSGEKLMTRGMEFGQDLIDANVDIYNTHRYKSRFGPDYGIEVLIFGNPEMHRFPLLTSLPMFLLRHMMVIHRNPAFTDRTNGTRSPSNMKSGLGLKMARTDPEEILRVALSNEGLWLDDTNTFTKKGLRTATRLDKGHYLGHMTGIIIKGGWRENREAFESLGNGLFEFDEATVNDKRICITKYIKDDPEDMDLINEADEDIYLIPAKYSPFRYAKFVDFGGNVRIPFKKETVAKISSMTLSVQMGVLYINELV